MIKTVLVVCIGNICRSPMAEGLFRQALPETNVVSAGLAALVGQPADACAVALMNELDLDITAHRARQLNGNLARNADLILVMDKPPVSRDTWSVLPAQFSFHTPEW